MHNNGKKTMCGLFKCLDKQQKQAIQQYIVNKG